MKKLTVLSLISLFAFSLFVNWSGFTLVQAENVDDSLKEVEEQLEEKGKELEEKKEIEEEVEAEKSTVGNQLNYTVYELGQTEEQLEEKRQAIDSLEQSRQKNKKEKEEKQNLMQTIVKELYVKGRLNPLEIFLSEGGFAKAISTWGQHQYFLKQREDELASLQKEIASLDAVLGVEEEEKEELRGEVAGLEQQKSALVVKKSELEALHSEIQEQISRLTSEIAGLSARQQELLAQKLGSFSTSVGDVPPPDDDPPPHFSGKAFAVYSFGAPHRVGMSQFGALGRARAGHNYQDILNAYYHNVRLEKRTDLVGDIEVYGYGRISLEDNYMRGIAEMPTSWADSGGFEALKAQAVAARTYAIAATGNGSRGICAGEGCQVYNAGKAASGAEAWYRAVQETRGEVLISNDTGQVITAWYSSTTGGYTLSSQSVWGRPTAWAQGIKDVKPGGAWPNDAWEGKDGGRSPWFYKAWYHPRSVAASRPSAWLTDAEFADILNATWLYTLDNSTAVHLSQTDKASGDTWSVDQVRSELQARGGTPISSISDVTDTTFSDGGFTLSVNIVTDQGMKSFSGSDFRSIFNLRAPGELFIASTLFNIEKR